MKRIFLLLFWAISFVLLVPLSAQRISYEIPRSPKTDTISCIHHQGYTLAYNADCGIPYWVAWRLDSTRLQPVAKRANKFLPDPTLPKAEAVTTADYVKTGWDRGHMCPAADNQWDVTAMEESFYMTNMCPQHSNLNRGDWKELEDLCRVWAKNEPLYIVCGPILYDAPLYGYIGVKHKVRVPDAFFKVVLTGMESGNPRCIGFIYTNEVTNHEPSFYCHNINQVESITGIDFFPELSDDIEETLEETMETTFWF